MSKYFVIAWFPYLVLVYRLYMQRSIWAPIILLVFASLCYRLPLYVGGLDGRMFHVGLLLCLGQSIAEAAQRRSWHKNEHDRVIWYAVFIYYGFIAISVIPATYDRLPTKIYTILDYSLLFFVCLRCIKNEMDARTLVKGAIFAISLMAAIGVIGYALDDPWWGQMVYDDEGAQVARSQPQLSFGEKHREAVEWNRDVSRSATVRLKSTAGDSNSFSLTMLLTVYLLMYFWFRVKRVQHKVGLAALLGLLVTGIILSGCRTVFIAGIISCFLFFVGLARSKMIQLSRSQFLSGIVLITVIVGGLASQEYLSKYSAARIQEVEGVEGLMDAQGRKGRWKYAISQMPLTVAVIGTGQPGAEGTSGAHNLYLSIIYFGGIWCLGAFCVLFLRAIRNALRMEDSLMGLCFLAILAAYAISGITLEHNHAVGPGYIFWPVIAILAKSVSPKSLLPYGAQKAIYRRRGS